MSDVKQIASTNQQETNNDNYAEAFFSNHQVDQDTLSTSELDTVSLSVHYRKMNVTVSFVFALAFVIIFVVVKNNWLFSIGEQHSVAVWSVFGVLFTASIVDLIYHFFADPLKQYALREHDLNYQSGLIFKSVVSQPILRIQHIEIKRGPIERKYGLATLQVFSAGGHSYTFTVPGLEYDTAISLRQFVLDHKDLAKDA